MFISWSGRRITFGIMATGDLNGSLRKIEQGLRLLNYPRDVDYTV